MSEKIGVLFVCLGNICRSPLAEGAFKSLVAEEGLADHFMIDSAGTSTWHLGKPPHELSQKVCQLKGFDISDQRARQVTQADYTDFHYILAMDKNNLLELRDRKPENATAKVGLLLNYANLGHEEVPDPYYGGIEDYQDVFFMVRQGAEGLLADIRKDFGI